MTDGEYLRFLKDARHSEFGLAVRVSDLRFRRHFRRKLYAARDKARESGDRSFDGLSVILRRGLEIWIVRRERVPGRRDADGDDGLRAASEPLVEEELPDHIQARGPNRPRPRSIPFYSLHPGLPE